MLDNSLFNAMDTILVIGLRMTYIVAVDYNIKLALIILFLSCGCCTCTAPAPALNDAMRA
jgi:hypothetical protein